MTGHRIVQVDAFATKAFEGNPAAVMRFDAWPDDALLQAIALENNLSETAFLVPDASEVADYELRWFTPGTEVALCGHATLASGHVLLSEDAGLSEVRFSTRKAGVLSVARNPDGPGYRMALPAYAPAPKDLSAMAAMLGGDVVETRWHPGRYGLFVYRDAAAILALKPDFMALRDAGDVLYIATAPGEETDVISRVFAPGAGIDEDPVTGSAHSVLAPYWAERLGRANFSAYQASARGGHVGCLVEGDRVVLTGQAVTVMDGVMRF